MAKLRWTVTFIVDETWIVDGFDLTDERAKRMIENELPFATPYETGAIVKEYPAAARVAAMQGSKDGGKGVEAKRREDALAGGKYYRKQLARQDEDYKLCESCCNERNEEDAL